MKESLQAFMGVPLPRSHCHVLNHCGSVGLLQGLDMADALYCQSAATFQFTNFRLTAARYGEENVLRLTTQECPTPDPFDSFWSLAYHRKIKTPLIHVAACLTTLHLNFQQLFQKHCHKTATPLHISTTCLITLHLISSSMISTSPRILFSAVGRVC